MARCANCNNLLPRSRNSARLYCSNACRSAQWRAERPTVVVQDVNGAREAEGLPPLVRDRRLDALAAQVAALQHHYIRRVVLEGEGAQARGPTSGPVLDADLTGIGVHVCYEGPTAFVTLVMGAAADQAPALPAPPEALPAPPPPQALPAGEPQPAQALPAAQAEPGPEVAPAPVLAPAQDTSV